MLWEQENRQQPIKMELSINGYRKPSSQLKKRRTMGRRRSNNKILFSLHKQKYKEIEDSVGTTSQALFCSVDSPRCSLWIVTLESLKNWERSAGITVGVHPWWKVTERPVWITVILQKNRLVWVCTAAPLPYLPYTSKKNSLLGGIHLCHLHYIDCMCCNKASAVLGIALCPIPHMLLPIKFPLKFSDYFLVLRC